jgi:protein-disulfide isomerase
MTRSALSRLALAVIALPLALGLAACGSKEADKTGGLSGEPIARVAPPAGKAWADVVAKTPEGGFRMGNPDAPIKLVEYGSMTCPHCADVSAKSSMPLRDEFVASGRVSFEFRNFVRDAIDMTAALLARCGSPESFFPLTEQAFANQAAMLETAQKAGEAAYTAAMNQPDDKRNVALAELMGLTDFFAARGIAKDQANMCLANVAEAQGLAKRTQEQSEQFDIQGTPTFLVNGQTIGSMDWEELRNKLQTMGAR